MLAGAEFAFKALRALSGEAGIITPSYVHLSSDPNGGAALQKELGQDIEYFAAPVELGVSEVSLKAHIEAKGYFHRPAALNESFLLGT